MVADCIPGFQPRSLCKMPEVCGLFCNNESLPSLPPAYPAFSLLFCPHPPDPLPGGKGGIYSFLMQGASPLASPRLSRKRHGLNRRKTSTRGGVPSLPPAYPAFSLLSRPHSPARARRALFPAGRGRFLVFLCKGLRPCIPGSGRGAALARRALAVPRGRLASWSPARPATATLGGVGQTKRGP